MTFEPLVGNRAIEDAAITYVMKLERKAGRQPVDRRFEATFAADISSPPRTIEVKAVGKDQRGWFVPVEARQYEAAFRDPHFYLYVVDNIRQGDPSAFRLKVFAASSFSDCSRRRRNVSTGRCPFRWPSSTPPLAPRRLLRLTPVLPKHEPASSA